MTDPNEPRKRFRLRRLTSFSLRTALIVMTVLAVWLGLHMNSVRKQRASVEAVLRHGGGVGYDYQHHSNGSRNRATEDGPTMSAWLMNTFGRDHFHDVVWVMTKDDFGYLEDPAHLDDWGEHERSNSADLLGQMDGFPNLEILWLDPSQANDGGLRYAGQHERLRVMHIDGLVDFTEQGVAHLAKLSKLESLKVSNAQITGDFIQELSRLPKIHYLRFNFCDFGNDGVKHMQKLTQVRELLLISNGQGITDDDLVHLTQLTRLENLCLGHSSITDDGLRHLVNLKNLRLLWLRKSQVKDAAWLQERLPNCKIVL